MGFERSTLKLSWPEDSEFHGFEVQMRRLSLRQLTEVQKLSKVITEDSTVELADLLSKAIIGWNLEEDGQPVPVTPDVLRDVDFAMIKGILDTWMEVAVGVPLASKKNSSDGATVPPDEEWESWMAQSQEILPAQG